MARLAVIADSHFDVSSRFEECVRIHDWIADDIAERGVDAIIHAGDIFERTSRIEERNAAAAWVQRCAEIAPVVILRGNHDSARDLEILGRLEGRNPISVFERPGVCYHVRDVAIACLPWPRKAELLAALGRDVAPEQAGEVAQAALRDVLRGLGNEARGPSGMGRVVLVSHAMVRGSQTSQGQPLVGCDMELGLEDLAFAGADAVLLGHIHMPQEWQWQSAGGGEVPIVYAGSPRRTAYGEVETKGYVIVDVGDHGIAVSRIPTPAQPMLLLEYSFVEPGIFVRDGHELHEEERGDVDGADVRFRWHVASDHAEVARAAASDVKRGLLEAGAARVTLDPVIRPVVRARTPEITEQRTLPDKLRCVWRARGEQFDAAREERVLGKLEELNEEEETAA